MIVAPGLAFLTPKWPVPSHVHAIITTRECGVSAGAFRQGNLALHVGDNPQHVMHNRQLLADQVNVPHWQWLNQTHGTTVALAMQQTCQSVPEADGSFTRDSGVACAVLTADCLPVLLCNTRGTQVAAVHAGWKGLCGGILQEAVRAFEEDPADILVYLGPAIGPTCFQVGTDVQAAYAHSLQHLPIAEADRRQNVQRCFLPDKNHQNKFFANIYSMARSHLSAMGIKAIFGGDWCTVTMGEHFFSYRRESVTGRFASAIWIG